MRAIVHAIDDRPQPELVEGRTGGHAAPDAIDLLQYVILVARPAKAEGPGGVQFVAAYIYILRCRDGSYYVGSTRDSLERRVNEHNAGRYDGFTKSRRPVELVYSRGFDRVTDAVQAERQLKGWSRAKKEALMSGDFDALVRLSKNRTDHRHSSKSSE